MPRTRAHAPGRPPVGFGHYLRDVVYGANDGIITTFVVVSGVTGASLAPAVAVILGIVNLVADGISMGASNYLALKSELEQTGRSVVEEMPWRHGAATFLAFTIAGTIPLLAYLHPQELGVYRFPLAIGLTLLALAGVGAARSPFVGRAVWRSASEMILVGGAAGVVAYAIGSLLQRFVM